MSEFDRFSRHYAEVNDRMLAGVGETTEDLSEYKADYLLRVLPPDFHGSILDYGCGVGIVTRAIGRKFPGGRLHGYDTSRASLDQARTSSPEQISYFSSLEELESAYDVIVLTNLLHHVAPRDRAGLIQDLERRLARGGKMVVFEHNPLNWIVMRMVEKHPFDANAVFLPHRESISLLESARLKTRLDFIFFFPGFLRPLRFLDRSLSWLPLGAQYACVGEK